MQVSWIFLKSLIDSKKLNFQVIDESTRYMISLFDNSYSLFCFVEKTTPKNADQLDYENNYSTDANKVTEDNVRDILNKSGLQGALTVGTSAVEVKVGASRLVGRKVVTVLNNSNNTIFWGYTSGVTTSSGSPIVKNQFAEFQVGDNLPIFLIAGSAGNNVRITEAG